MLGSRTRRWRRGGARIRALGGPPQRTRRDLHSNSLSGTIPSELGGLSQLAGLGLVPIVCTLIGRVRGD